METRADEFVTQAREHLTDLEQVLLSLEKPSDPADNRERIDRCLRLVHSVKGDAGFLGYTAIRTLANSMAPVLEASRRELGLPAIVMEVQTERAVPLSVELAQWVRASQRSLGKLLADLECLGKIEDSRLDFGMCDLATMLPTGPVILRGWLRTP